MTDSRDILTHFWKELDKSPFLMLGIPAQGAHSLPMTAQLDENAHGAIWFYTRSDNRLIEGLTASRDAMAQYVSKGHNLYACVSGTLAIETDSRRIDQFWSNAVQAWYEGGKHDPALVMLRFDLLHGEFWENDLSVGGKLKLLFGGTIEQQDVAGMHLESQF